LKHCGTAPRKNQALASYFAPDLSASIGASAKIAVELKVMKRTATSLLLIGLLLCTQSLLAACGVRCSLGMDASHTAAMQSMQHCGSMETSWASASEATAVMTSPCCEQSCNQHEATQVAAPVDDTLQLSSIGHLHAHLAPGLLPHTAIVPVVQEDFDLRSRLKPAALSTRTILNIRV
jgi:hypothetical protein